MEARHVSIKEFLAIKETDEFKNDKDKFYDYRYDFVLDGVLIESYIQDAVTSQDDSKKTHRLDVILMDLKGEVLYFVKKECVAPCEVLDWSKVSCGFDIKNIIRTGATRDTGLASRSMGKVQPQHVTIKEFLAIKETDEFKRDENKFYDYRYDFVLNGVLVESFIQDAVTSQDDTKKTHRLDVILMDSNEETLYFVKKECVAPCEVLDWSKVSCGFDIKNIVNTGAVSRSLKKRTTTEGKVLDKEKVG